MKIETKYNIGDKLWAMHNNKPKELIITSITVRINTTASGLVLRDTKYEGESESELGHFHFGEKDDDVYSSKEDLIKSL